MIRIASVALPKSPINLAQGDEIPQIITRITRRRPAEFLTTCAKRLLQQYRSKGDIGGRPDDVCFAPKNGHPRVVPACPPCARTELMHHSKASVRPRRVSHAR